MRYSRAALGLLNAQYRSVLKKCFLINLGLFAWGVSVGTANAAVTLSPILDSLKSEAQKAGAVSSEAYTLTKLNDGETVPEDKAAVKIGGSVYYFSPNAGEDVNLLSILAGTSAASVDDAANPTKISFNAENIPASSFSYVEGSESDYNFVIQEADQDGNITKKYYKVVLRLDNMRTSPNISWEKVSADKKDETGVIPVKLPNGQTEYYKYNSQPTGRKIFTTQQTNLSGDINADFVGSSISSSYIFGGAINNSYDGTIGNITGDFIGNYISASSSEAYGGAIFNNGTLGNITGDFIGNYASSSKYVGGGAIFNNGTLGNITGDFIGNYASSSSSSHNGGGAIYNYRGTIGNITGDFIGNYASSVDGGGAIYNDINGTIGNITGDFIGNYAFSSSSSGGGGGAIYSIGTIGNITGDFIGNYASSSSSYSSEGGAIYNNYGTIGNITGDFIGNYTSSIGGGAIYNCGIIGNITGDFTGNYVSSSSTANGGAVQNYGGRIIKNITGDFIGNYASSLGDASGGAINNSYSAILENITGDFIGNYTSSSTFASGGAIQNIYGGVIVNITGDFIGNSASSSSTANGGAIYNSYGGWLTIAGASTFTDNYVEVNGFKTSNAIHNTNNGTINFNSGSIVINDAITGENYSSSSKSIFNFSGQQTATSDNDVITLNNSLTNTDSSKGNIEVNLTQGTLKLGHYDSTLFNTKFIGTLGDSVDFNVNGGSLTTQDGEIHKHNLGNLNLNADLNTSIDVNLQDKTGDKLTGSTAATSANGNKILIDNIKVLNDGTNHIVKIEVADENIKDVMSLADNVTIEMNPSDTNSYLVVYEKDNASGNLKFGQVDALETAVQFENANKAFAMGADIATDTDLGALTGTSLSISGNGHTIDGKGFDGMLIADNQTVSLNDVTVEGFNGVFAENNGTMNIAASAGNELNLNSGISGSGNINANGAGKLNLNSDITANKMTVSSGELNLQHGSELANVENFVANGGVLNVGDQTIKLKNAEFNDGSTVAINVKSDGNGLLKADSLTVNGGNLKATLGQGVVDLQSKQKTITLLESGTAFTNNFADVMENNMYRFEKAEKAGDYIISLAKTAEEVSQENGGSSNNSETAKGWVDGSKFEQGSVSADVADKLADLAQNDAKGFNEALTALAPSDTPEVRTNSVNNNSQMFKAVVTHLDDGYQRARNGLSSGDVVDGVSVWAKAFGNHTKVDDTAKAYGFKSDGYGATLGIEKQLTSVVKAGLGYSYFYNDIDGFRRDSDVNTHTGFVYGEYRPNNWFVNAIASYGYSEYNETKHVAGDKYKAEYNVDNIGAQVMTGYNANVLSTDVTPESGLRFNHIHRDNYVDEAGQAVKAESMDVLTAVAGVKLGKDLVSCFGLNEVYWRPEARLAATYDLISDKENATVSLANGSGYVVKGQRLNRFGIEAGAGVTFYLTPDVESSIGYEGKFRSHYQDHTGYVSAKYKF